MTDKIRLLGIYLFAADVSASASFYEAIGLDIERISQDFVRATWGDTVMLEIGSSVLTLSYDPQFETPDHLSKSTINFSLDSEAAVDELFTAMVDEGYIGHLAPCLAPWQARFAIIEDPDGNFVGLHSPRDVDADRGRERQ